MESFGPRASAGLTLTLTMTAVLLGPQPAHATTAPAARTAAPAARTAARAHSSSGGAQ